jgi:hypothetical protein
MWAAEVAANSGHSNDGNGIPADSFSDSDAALFVVLSGSFVIELHQPPLPQRRATTG